MEKLVLIAAMAISQLAFAQEGIVLPHSTDLYCKQAYVDEIYRLKDIYDNSDAAKDAKALMAKADKRYKKDKIIGAIATGAIVAGVAGTWVKTDPTWKVEDKKGGYILALYLGGLASWIPGSEMGGLFYKLKESEKQASLFLGELTYKFKGLERGLDIVTAAKIIVEREKYLPDEVLEAIKKFREFLTAAKIDMKIEDATAKFVDGDNNKIICPDNIPMHIDELVKWLTTG